jgi:hypothetical protein
MPTKLKVAKIIAVAEYVENVRRSRIAVIFTTVYEGGSVKNSSFDAYVYTS